MVKKSLNIIIIFLLLALISLGVLTYYLYKIRIVENITYKDIRKDVTDTSISNIEAEKRNLLTLVKKNENPDLEQIELLDLTSNTPGIKPAYKINLNTIEKVAEVENNQVPLFFTDNNSEYLDDLSVLNMLLETIKRDNLAEIDIDVTITNKVNNIEALIKDLIYNLTPTNIKINLGLPAKWSDIQDYEHLATVSRFYSSNVSVEVINNLTNKIRLHAYGFTSINSSKAGPISPSQWVENTIAYYLYKGISPSKLDLVINNNGYKWANRGFTDNYIHNFVVSTQQAQIVTNRDLNQLISTSNLRNLPEFNIEENVAIIETNHNINYIVYPKLSLISSLKDLVKTYGLNGFIYKNY